MERLRNYEWWFMALLVPLWAICFGLSLRHLAEPRGLPSVYITTAETGEYPIVETLTPEASTSLINRGDRLRNVGGIDLRGVNRIEYLVRFVSVAGSKPKVFVLFERKGEVFKTELAVDSLAVTSYLLPASFMFTLAAVLLFLRGGSTPQIRAFFLAFMTAAIYLSANFFGSRAETYAALVLHGALMTVSPPLMCRAFLRFPYYERQTSPYWRFGPWILSVLGPLHMSRYGLGLPRDIGVPAVVIGTVTYFLLVLYIMNRNYRQADLIGRRQIRWVIFGTYLAVLPVITAGVLTSADARWMDLYIGSLSAVGFVPLTILISIIRFNLFDVDRLISATATYNILFVVAIVLGIVMVPKAAEIVTHFTSLNATISQSMIAIPLVALVVLVQPRMRPLIERIFFTERYALDRGFENLLQKLMHFKNTTDLIQGAGQGFQQILRPESCVIYGRDASAFTPLYVHGKSVPSALPSNSLLAKKLARRSTPIVTGISSGWHNAETLGDFDRASLESLNAAIVAPVNRGGQLVGMLCLGPKRSGDVYTPTDVRLIGAAADRVSAQLERIDRAEFAAEAREMQDSLRRYVPGAVADQLARGLDLESEEREVSVLFVDLRGYTAYAQDLRPDEIFSTINQFTETISRLIQEQGGSVVEFNGDGMMAVFGAPNELDQKEAAAVRAAMEIVSTIGSLPRSQELNVPLSVGAGIATGPAFIGNIRAADRWIWSAIGNTTNLASRLQSLTRDLDIAIAIDVATREAAGIEADDFELYANVPIRGRRQVQDIYVLPFKEPL